MIFYKTVWHHNKHWKKAYCVSCDIGVGYKGGIAFLEFNRGEENKDKYNPGNNNFHKIVVRIPWYGLKEQIQIPKISFQAKGALRMCQNP